MALGITLGQRQEQRLLLLPKMLQAIEILQLSTHDLLATIEQELAENEALDLADGDPAATPEDDVDRPEPRDEEGGDWLGRVPAHSLSLHAHLLAQVAMLELGPALREVVSFLIGSLDGNGHLLLARDELATFCADGALAEEALTVLRSLDPRGVGATSPTESMVAQLDPEDPDCTYLEPLIRHHLDDLARNCLPKVAKRLGVSIEDLKQLLGKLKALDPCPGRAFAAEEPRLIDPDVVVRREDGEWQVYVDDARVPALMVSRDYAALARAETTPQHVRRYLDRKLGAARDLMRAIEQRRETLGRVARAVVDRQQAFLERGRAALEPLGMQEIADAVGVHLSTVSRAAAGKYIQTDLGVFPLRSLFDGGVAAGAGAAGPSRVSRASARDRVRRLIDSEDPAQPYADGEIARRLASTGVVIARRTVAKYRRELGIPSRWRRREH